MGTREDALMNLGYEPEEAPTPAGLYSPMVVSGSTAYLSGMIPLERGAVKYAGKVPSQVSADEAKDAAALCAANLLRVIARDLGSLDRIAKIVKLTGFVNSDPEFAEQHVVINGASQLMLDVLGEAGKHARSALGVANLPLGSAVEVELIVELV